MWDERYNQEEYVYGTEPNDFLKANAEVIPKGTVLNLAEGEGRNAVFLAKKGYQVTAVDSSSVGLKKAERLAQQAGVSIQLIHANILEYDIGQGQWDGIVSIFFPLGSADRIAVYKNVARGLKRNGVFLLEAYTPRQLGFGTGGGENVEMMQSKETLQEELRGLRFDHLMETERVVQEGKYHTGNAAVLQAIARQSE